MRQRRNPLLSGAFESQLKAWMDLTAEDAARESLNAVMKLMRQGLIDGPPLGLRQDDADKKLKEWLRPIAEAFFNAGVVVAGNAANSLVTRTRLASLFAAQSRSHSGTVMSLSPSRERKGGIPAPWKTKAVAVIKDGRRKLVKESNNIIIDELVNLGIIAVKGNAYVDAKTMKQCATSQKDMSAQISKLKIKTVSSKKIAK